MAISLGILAYIVSKIPLRDHAWTVMERHGSLVTLRNAAGKVKTLDLKRFELRPGETWVERGFASVVRDIKPVWVALAAAAFFFVPVFASLRWRQLLHVQDVRLSVWMTLKLCWIGLFFNLFLLGSVGGDLVKAYFVSKHTASRAESMITVLVDRIIGLLGLVWLSAAAMGVWLIWRPGGGEIPGGLPWAWLMPGVPVILLGVVFYVQRFRQWFGINRLTARLRPDHMIRRLDAAVYLYRQHKTIIAQAFGLTFLSHVGLMASVYFGAVALDIGDPRLLLPYVIIFAPLIFVATGLIPSIGGLGVQEYGFVLFFSGLKAGMDTTAIAIALSLVYRVVTIFWGLPGAGLLMMGMHLPSRAQMRQELDNGRPGPEAST